MKHTKRLAAMVIAASLVAAACGSDDDTSSDATDAPATDETTAPAEGEFAGKTVTLFSSIRDEEAVRLEAAWKPFEDSTGIDIVHEPSAEFEAQLKVRVEGGNAPDIAAIPQPGLLANLARDGKLVPLPNLEADAKNNDIAGFAGYGTVDGVFYAPPLGANIKSLVWYSPAAFTEGGYEIPASWDDMLALSDKIVADGGTPWCAGIESGGATGWPATDWIEDAMLRFADAETYDKWVAHTIPFNDPAVKAAAEAVGGILLNADYVGDPKSIATTPFQEGGLGILDGSCFMHRQASFYGNQFPEGTTKGPDGQVNAFYLPMASADDPKAMLGGAEFMAAFNDKPEVEAVIKYLTSADYATSRAKIGNWLSPNKGLDPAVYTDPLEQNFAKLLQGSEIFRFDASDLMPGEVGAGSFWTGMVDWITGKDIDTVLDEIEKSWPAA